MIFGDGVGASLVRGSYCQLCWFVWDVYAFRAAEEGAWVGSKPDLQGGTGFNLLRVSFGPPYKGNVFKKGQKVDPLEIKTVPPGGSSFGPFIVANLLKHLFQAEADFTNNSSDWNLELGRPVFARLLFVTFWGPKKAPSLSYCFALISIALRPWRPASKPAPKCLVLISTVSRHWSSRLALKPASNFVSSYNFFVLLQFSIPLKLRGLPWGRPFAPAAA